MLVMVLSRLLEGRIPMDAGTVYGLILPFAVSLFETVSNVTLEEHFTLS